MKSLLFLFVLIPSLICQQLKASHPPEPTKVAWTIDCELKTQKISVEIKTTDPEDSPETQMIATLNSPTPVDLLLAKSALIPVPPTNKKFGVCASSAGILVDKTKLLLLIGKAGYQEYNRLNAILIDTENLTVLDTALDIGDFLLNGKNKILLKKISGGLGVLIPQGWRKNTTNENPDNLYMGWLQVTIVGNKINQKWEMELPKNYRPYQSKIPQI